MPVLIYNVAYIEEENSREYKEIHMNTKTTRIAGTRKEREIWEVCEKINSEKRPLTYLAIGETLVQMGYRRGSNSDIRRYLKSWRKNHIDTSASSAPEVIEQGLSHFDLTRFSATPSAPPSAPAPAEQSRPSIQDLIQFYEHHVKQVDRLLNIIDNLKKDNHLLREKLRASAEQKPRMIYKQPA